MTSHTAPHEASAAEHEQPGGIVGLQDPSTYCMNVTCMHKPAQCLSCRSGSAWHARSTDSASSLNTRLVQHTMRLTIQHDVSACIVEDLLHALAHALVLSIVAGVRAIPARVQQDHSTCACCEAGRQRRGEAYSYHQGAWKVAAGQQQGGVSLHWHLLAAKMSKHAGQCAPMSQG